MRLIGLNANQVGRGMKELRDAGGAVERMHVSPWRQEDQLTFLFVYERAVTFAGRVLWADQDNELGMLQTNFDSPQALNKVIFALKDLHNAIAHNGVILDVRFKTASIHGSIKNLIDIGTEVSDVTFNEVTDYALLLLYMMSELSFTKTECKQFL